MTSPYIDPRTGEHFVAADAARDPEWSATCGPYELRVAAKDGAR